MDKSVELFFFNLLDMFKGNYEWVGEKFLLETWRNFSTTIYDERNLSTKI